MAASKASRRTRPATRAKKRTVKRGAPGRATVKRAVPKRVVAKRAVVKRAAPKRVVAKRAVVKRAVPKRTAVKRVALRRTAAKRTTPNRASVKHAATPSIPNGIGLIGQHLDFTSHDLDGVRRFYTELLGFTKFQHDTAVDYLNIAIAPGVSIGFMPPMPGPPEPWRPPREPALYLVVEDVDRACSALVEKGVALDQPPTDMSWGDRVALLRDPEGRMVCIAQHVQKG